jgi:hypothetical protein
MTVPSFLDDWFGRHEPKVSLRYVGMRREEALSAATSDGVARIRVIEIPAQPNSGLTADLHSRRLNFVIVDDRVLRAAFF